MTRIKKALALILVLTIVITAGVLTVSAAEASADTGASPALAGNITVHAKQDGVTQPYIYLWNSLPTNSAMSPAYPGEKMTATGNWFDYTATSVTKVNVLITDADGKQYSKEQKLTANAGEDKEWWFLNGKWYKHDPEQVDPTYSLDLREETIYFVMTTRFYDGDSGNNVHCWDDNVANNPDSDPAWRGDFKGLAEKLDYIKALGFSAIWITPVVTNASGYDYHGYHAMDFSTVDVRYESDDFDFQDLIRAAHEKDMKIVQDVVFQHTGNFGESYFCNLFEKDTTKDLGNLEESMIPTQYLLDSYGLNSAEDYWAQPPGVQYSQRLNLMKNTTYPGNVGNTTGNQPAQADFDMIKVSQDPKYNPNNYYHTGYFQSPNYDDWTTKFSQIAGDCVDLNTENPAVAEYVVDCYANYINMGVDAFRVDTVRHIPRLSLNMMFNDQIYDAARVAGKSGFMMFGEICTRYSDVWYRGHAEESTPYYTWKEKNSKWADSWSWDTTPEAINDNMNLVLQHYLEEDNLEQNHNQLEEQSDNAFLGNNLTYHTPDRSQASGMEAIDFQMHRKFGSASTAFNFATGVDQYYNDATYNVMYVDSHDYAPEQPEETTRFTGGTQTWAENLDLMFTFRGIPCVYYGSEVEFQKGCLIDKGTLIPLSTSGRAYYGDYLTGDVTATDFGEYTASGTVATTLESKLSKQMIKLNKIRRSIPALQKGQYTASSNYVTGDMAFIRRYTDSTTDSLACVTISGAATFKNIPNGTYIDAVTGDVKNVTNGTLTTSALSKANMRVYVCCASGFKGINGAIGGVTDYLK